MTTGADLKSLANYCFNINIIKSDTGEHDQDASIFIELKRPNLPEIDFTPSLEAKIGGHSKSYGKRLRAMIEKYSSEIPEAVSFSTVRIPQALYDRVEFQRYLADLLQDSNCKLLHVLAYEKVPSTHWKVQDEIAKSLKGDVIICLKDVNPYHVLGCLTAAIEDSRSKLGVFSSLYDASSISQIPQVGKYVKNHSHKNIS